MALLLAYPAYSTLACDLANSARHVVADGSQADKNKPDCRKRADGQRATPEGKPCTDGGERLPQDKRSPLDNLPPLSPLVA
jgi:hypothetical protein